MTPIATSYLENKLGATISIENVTWSWSGELKLNEFTIEAPEVKGGASEVIVINKASLTLDSWQPFVGAELVSVDIDSIRLRFAESIEDAGVFNISNLFKEKESIAEELISSKPESQVAGKTKDFPTIEIQNVIVESGTMGDGQWVINGTKMWISSAEHSGLFVVWAVTDPERPKGKGISCFLVECGAPGITIGKGEHKMGQRGSSTNPVIFEDCHLPADAILGKRNDGFRIAIAELAGGDPAAVRHSKPGRVLLLTNLQPHDKR